MEQATIIGIDISKKSFQLHGATAEGEPVFRKTLSRGRFLAFLSEMPSCLVVMEACGGAHHWGRAIIDLGHECRLIPPVYVKPFVKRQKNDSNDAAAIVEAAQRPTMRFVAVKSEAAQSDSMLFRTRALLVRQRTQTINALRGPSRRVRRDRAAGSGRCREAAPRTGSGSGIASRAGGIDGHAAVHAD